MSQARQPTYMCSRAKSHSTPSVPGASHWQPRSCSPHRNACDVYPAIATCLQTTQWRLSWRGASRRIQSNSYDPVSSPCAADKRHGTTDISVDCGGVKRFVRVSCLQDCWGVPPARLAGQDLRSNLSSKHSDGRCGRIPARELGSVVPVYVASVKNCSGIRHPADGHAEDVLECGPVRRRRLLGFSQKTAPRLPRPLIAGSRFQTLAPSGDPGIAGGRPKRPRDPAAPRASSGETQKLRRIQSGAPSIRNLDAQPRAHARRADRNDHGDGRGGSRRCSGCLGQAGAEAFSGDRGRQDSVDRADST